MVKFDTDKLRTLCEPFISLDDTALTRLSDYGNLLLEWNEKINLTAITEPDEVLIKHFYDCLLFFKNIEVPQGASVIDVGTGAGFPGIVLAIARPDIKLCLLDSLNKRINFLREVCDKLSLSAVAVHSRAEEGARKPEHREQYDIACARAVAALPTLAEYCMPYVKEGGRFVAMKGPSAEEEIKAAYTAIKTLGGEKAVLLKETLPDESARSFVIVKKISQTPTKYPRTSAKIAKQPL